MVHDKLRTAYTAEEKQFRDEISRRETALEEGLEESRKEGIEEGIDLINQLNEILIENNEYDKLKKAIEDKDYQRKLFIHYKLIEE